MWADIDYLDAYKTFTISPAYSKLKDYVTTIKQEGIKFVPILDPGVAVVSDPSTYSAFKTGLEQDVFIKSSDMVHPLIGNAWPGKAVFPDWTKANTTKWWHSMLDYLYNTLEIQFDGIWLDENEVTNDCNGYCDNSQRPLVDSKNYPIYVPGQR